MVNELRAVFSLGGRLPPYAKPINKYRLSAMLATYKEETKDRASIFGRKRKKRK
jgi:hypothetical protein